MKHFEGRFSVSKKIDLYYQGWLPDEPKAILVVVHGYGEHSGRYGNLVNYFLPRNYGVYTFDLRGHGKSGGVRGYTDRFSRFLDDLGVYLEIVKSRHAGARTFLVGHSTGGTIAAAYTILRRQDFDGLILSGAILSPPADVPPITILAARVLSRLIPGAGLYSLDSTAISQDKEVVNAYVGDPLVYSGKVRARFGVELMNAMAEIRRRIPEIRLPVLIMHGTADRIANPEGSQTLYREASSTDKTFRPYSGYYHEIMNEPGRQQVLDDIDTWLTARIQAGPALS